MACAAVWSLTDGTTPWTDRDIQGLDAVVPLVTIAVDLSMASIYDGTWFEAGKAGEAQAAYSKVPRKKRTTSALSVRWKAARSKPGAERHKSGSSAAMPGLHA